MTFESFVDFGRIAFRIALLAFASTLMGCSSIEKKQYVFWGDVVTETPSVVQDHWTDYGPFVPKDSEKKMRRGKAGVVRFFKEHKLDRSIPVEGDLIVYVFSGAEEGIELSEPMAKLTLTSEQLEKQRKFDKKIGYTYHIWLDLGEIDLPEENISILSVFIDAKTSNPIRSGMTYTRAVSGLNTLPAKKSASAVSDKQADGQNLDPEKWAREFQKRQAELSANESPVSANASSNQNSASQNSANVETQRESPDGSESNIIELSPALTQQFQNSTNLSEGTTARFASEQSASSSEKYAAISNPSNASAASNPAPAMMEISSSTLGMARSDSIYLPNRQKKLSFDEIRQVTGPSPSGYGAYFTQGYSSASGNVQLDQAFVPKESGANVILK